MKKLVGYVLAIGGLVGLAVGLGTFKLENELISSLGSSTISVIGGILIIVGVFIALKAEKNNSIYNEEEVPIYEGTGKHRRIVGYRRN